MSFSPSVERASFEAIRAERRYRAVDPDNRLVARGLEREWEERLSALEAAKVELSRREEARPRGRGVFGRARKDVLGGAKGGILGAAFGGEANRDAPARGVVDECSRALGLFGAVCGDDGH